MFSLSTSLESRGYDVVYTEGTLSADDIRGIHSVRPFTVLAVNLPASEPDDEVRGFCSELAKELELKRVLVTWQICQQRLMEQRQNRSCLLTCRTDRMGRQPLIIPKIISLFLSYPDNY
ncbi:MAG: hypothetical protein MZV63_59430 [Marinilabiliales bacterium]|nr:hypothetical protein [Marinilabiliales bacterium]